VPRGGIEHAQGVEGQVRTLHVGCASIVREVARQAKGRAKPIRSVGLTVQPLHCAWNMISRKPGPVGEMRSVNHTPRNDLTYPPWFALAGRLE
jgi:hypothetical protein